MATRKPLVIISGISSELPPGDLVPGIDTAAQASGNAALVAAENALASGNLGIADAAVALASGNAALIVGESALASGNAALADAATALASGNAALVVGVDALASGNAALVIGTDALASGNAALANAATALASGNAALSGLSNKYDKAGGPISGPVIVQSQSVGSPKFVNSSGVCILNFGTGNNFEVVLTAATSTFASPINASGGQTGTITLRQDNTGSRLVVYSGSWSFTNNTAPTLTTSASGVDLLAYYVVNPGRILTVPTLNYSSGTVS
jgi:hypothetical protein